ncbi:unnamed protein product [Mycena citricolor]|uniref:Fanconi-associated nuclease n=1 Tax=Mycena citricolor TaxID=2018698 RepID=A0AAD2HT08_9AGAR|nr:unnamed protein product [Mycena citricolor]
MERLRNIADALIYGVDEVEIEDVPEICDEDKTGLAGSSRPSLYVQVIERAINNIRDSKESALFSEEEWSFLDTVAGLEYNARFVLIRLLFRTQDRWFRLSDLRKYVSEIGPNGAKNAIEQLCKPLRSGKPSEVIDLTLDSDEDEDTKPLAGPSTTAMRGGAFGREEDVCLDYFCQDESDMSTGDGLRLLNVDELKDLCNSLGIKHAQMKKDHMIFALNSHASSQSVLAFKSNAGSSKSKSSNTKLRQSTLPFANRLQTTRLRELMLKKIGKAVQLNPYIHTLLLRLHVIWFRSTEFPESLFQPALFAGFKKRTYAEYEHKRHTDIWATREITWNTKMQSVSRQSSKNFCGLKLNSVDHGPVTAPARAGGVGLLDADEDDEDDDAVVTNKARQVKAILDSHVIDKWKALVIAEDTRTSARRPGLERFEPGFVYTRCLRKCLEALATLKEFGVEKDMLDLLLSQTFWRRGSRGRWYDRRALVQMTYLHKNFDKTLNLDVLREARQGVILGLADKDTAIVCRPPLIRRIDRLEKSLKIPAELKTQYDPAALNKPTEIYVTAIRFWGEPETELLKENKQPNKIVKYLAREQQGSSGGEKLTKQRPSWTGKSLWQGRDGVVNVETCALEDYELRGYKGFHSETQVLTTVFGLLFWDVLFAPVPGAFETPWQMGPLDIAEDSFYHARQQLIDLRLDDIRNGKARSILEEVDIRHRENKTCCVGVGWEMCSREDLVEIVECLGGEVLALICKLFCEDYGGRSSGVPDLIVWNAEEKECMFVEVKGPGDTLQENQKVLWSDVLITAGCRVELCHVLEPESLQKREDKAKAKIEKAAAAIKKRRSSNCEDEENSVEKTMEPRPLRKRRKST